MKTLLLLCSALMAVFQLTGQVIAGDTTGLETNTFFTSETVNIVTFAPLFGNSDTEYTDSLDLNRDGQTDLEFRASSCNTFDCFGGLTNVYSRHGQVEFMVDSNNYVLKLDIGNAINSGQKWAIASDDFPFNTILASNGYGIAGAYTFGNWAQSPVGFAGVRITGATDTLYGWIKIQATASSASASASIKIQSWAINSPNTPNSMTPFIIAGSYQGLVSGNKQILLHLDSMPYGSSAGKVDSIDLNEDGRFDVALNVAMCNSIDCMSSSSLFFAMHKDITFAQVSSGFQKNYAENDTIFANAPWNTSVSIPRYGTLSSFGTGLFGQLPGTGEWFGNNDGYVAVRLITAAADTLFGWVHVFTYTNANAAAHLEVDSWAIEYDPSQKPFIQVSTTPTKTVYCPGDTVTFQAETVGAEEVAWEFWDGTTSTENTVTRVLPDTSVQVLFQATNATGMSTSITQLEVSTLELTTSDIALSCAMPTAILSATTNIPATIDWVVGSDTIFSPNVPTIETAGTILVLATDDYGCIATSEMAITLDVVAPEVNIEYLEDTHALTAFSTTTGVVLVWTGDALPEPVFLPTIIVTEPGIYTVIATAPNGCTSSASYQVIISSQTEPLSLQIKVLPNPVGETVSIENNADSPVVFDLVDITGRQVLALGMVDAGTSTRFSLVTLASGSYWLRVRKSEGQTVVVRKLIKM